MPAGVVVEVSGLEQTRISAQTSSPDLSHLEDFVCPQCGGIVAVPRRVDSFACSWCGSLLEVGTSLRFYRRFEQVCVSRERATQVFRAWLSSPFLPRSLRTETAFDVGQLEFFPFLRLKSGAQESGAKDHLLPMSALPVPEVLELARIPASLTSKAADPGEEAGPFPPAPDPELLSEALRRAQSGGYTEVVLEQRGYYVVLYRHEGQRYRALVDAAGGRVFTTRRPARLRSNREPAVSMGVAALLATEALLIPGFLLAAAVVSITSLLLFFALRPWLRNG